VDLFSDETLDADKAASFLCADCLNEILPQKLEQCFGVGIIDLNTKEIRLLEENLKGFGVGDFYIDIDLKDENSVSRRMDILIFYCPIRNEVVAKGLCYDDSAHTYLGLGADRSFAGDMPSG